MTTTDLFISIRGHNDDDVAMITEKLGLQPSRIKRGGMAHPTLDSVTIPLHVWQYTSPLDKHAHVDEHIAALLEVLRERENAFRELREMFDAGLHGMIRLEPKDSLNMYGLCLWKPTIATLSALRLSITFDIVYPGVAAQSDFSG